MGLLDIPAPEPTKPVVKLTAPLIWHWVIYPLSSNSNRVKLALLKSISTGTFVDIRFYAYTAVRDGVPVNPKPLFASSAVIGEWEPAMMAGTLRCSSRFITLYSTRHKKAMGVEPGEACVMDELTDDYDCCCGELPETLHMCKPVLSVRGC